MNKRLLEALEKAKKEEGIDRELAKSSALLSPMKLDDIRQVDLNAVIERTKRKVNLEIARYFKDEGI